MQHALNGREAACAAVTAIHAPTIPIAPSVQVQTGTTTDATLSNLCAALSTLTTEICTMKSKLNELSNTCHRSSSPYRNDYRHRRYQSKQRSQSRQRSPTPEKENKLSLIHI